MSEEHGKKLSNEELLKKVAELESKLALESVKRGEAEELAYSMAAGKFRGAMAEEYATGKTVMVSTCTNPWEKKADKQKWLEVEQPTYFYQIDIPKGVGASLSTNGVEFFHGHTYEFDLDTLREIKARVAATWYHERSIHGENENAYKQRKDPSAGLYAKRFGF